MSEGLAEWLATQQDVELQDLQTGRFGKSATAPEASGHVTRSWAHRLDDLPSYQDVRARRQVSGLWHLNARHDLAHEHISEFKPEREEKQEQDPHVIVFTGPDDSLNPHNWSLRKKLCQTALLCNNAFLSTIASSIFSTATDVVARDFRVSAEVSTLGTSLYLMGYVLGPLAFGPASEIYGRRMPLLVGGLLLCVFSVPCAVGQNFETLMLGRFFSGFGAAGSLTIVPGCLADMWSPEARGLSISAYGIGAVAGPAMGPVNGSFITQSYLGWRWTEYIIIIWAGLILILDAVFLVESFSPIILQKKAKRIRYQTKVWETHAKLDETEITAHDIMRTYLLRPIAMLCVEPVLLLLTLYMSFLYGILFSLFTIVPYVMIDLRGFDLGTQGLTFIAFFVGALLSVPTVQLLAPRYNRILHERQAISVPEERCWGMAIGSISFPVGLFIWGWTEPLYVASVWPSLVGLFFTGYGFMLIWRLSSRSIEATDTHTRAVASGFQLIIDVYLFQAASAMAANTFLRSFFGAGFPLFALQMYKNLGTQWASSLLALLAVVFAPFPLVFHAYCDKLLANSKYAPKIPAGKQDGEGQ